jgi:RNA polymerase sigma factor (sigma-70 family)
VIEVPLRRPVRVHGPADPLAARPSPQPWPDGDGLPDQRSAFDDSDLLCRVRHGDADAFAALYRRHIDAALAWARRWTHDPLLAEDLCAEAFTRALDAMRHGHGPSDSLRPYIWTVIRNISLAWTEREQLTRKAAIAAVRDAARCESDPLFGAVERALAAAAFIALPERWRRILEYTLIEGMAPTQIAPLLGIDALAVSALAYRAREGLRQAYLQSHIARIRSESCRPYTERLGAYIRGRVSVRQRTHIRGHLTSCAECGDLFTMLRGVNATLAASESARGGRFPHEAADGGQPRDFGADDIEVPFADSVGSCRFERSPRVRPDHALPH